MSRTFDLFVLQIKCDHRSAMALVRNHKQFFAELRLEIIANLLNFRRQRFPAAQTIARVAAPKMKTGAAQNIRIEREYADHEAEKDCGGRENPDAPSSYSLMPVRYC